MKIKLKIMEQSGFETARLPVTQSQRSRGEVIRNRQSSTRTISIQNMSAVHYHNRKPPLGASSNKNIDIEPVVKLHLGIGLCDSIWSHLLLAAAEHSIKYADLTYA